MAAALAALASAPATASDQPFVAWADDRHDRAAASTLLDGLRRSLLAEPSATATLGRWCVAHTLSADGRLVADRIRGPQPPLDAAGLALLRAADDRALRYRHVRLSCNGHLLSEARNWYVADRLTEAMNRTLDTTDTPFGTVVRPLGFARATLSSRLLWSPSAGEPGLGPLPLPDALIENRAVLRRADGQPFALVVESYRRGLLEFRPPAP